MAACPLKPVTVKFLMICKISWWVIFKVHPLLGCHHHETVGYDVEVVEELATFIFMVKWEGWKCSWDGLIGPVMSPQALAPPIICLGIPHLPMYLWVHPCMHPSCIISPFLQVWRWWECVLQNANFLFPTSQKKVQCWNIFLISCVVTFYLMLINVIPLLVL